MNKLVDKELEDFEKLLERTDPEGHGVGQIVPGTCIH